MGDGTNGDGKSAVRSNFGIWRPQTGDQAFELVTASIPSIGDAYLFDGLRFDPESGLYWCDGRYFAAAPGRFIERAAG